MAGSMDLFERFYARPEPSRIPPRTPSPLGSHDAADPNVRAELGDTPSPVGMLDGAERRAGIGPAQQVLPACVIDRDLALQLDYFPVRYEAGFVPRAPEANENSVQTWRAPGTPADGSIIIRFYNSFARPRANHGAIDIFGPIGSPVVATSTQTVVDRWRYGREISGVTYVGAPRRSAEYSADGGNAVRTIDGFGFIHYYCHLRDRPLVRPGALCRAGQTIGYLGDTGNAQGDAHLHYQTKFPRALRRHLEDRYGMTLGAGPGMCRYDAFGGNNVNPYDELVRLADLFSPRPIIRGIHHVFAPGASPP